MAEHSWIEIPNWARFQHYTDRRPIWIKNYIALLADPDYIGLTLRQRGLLHGIWLAYANSGLALGSSPAHIGFVLGSPTVRARDIESLNHAGFLHVSASKPLAQRQRQKTEKSDTSYLTETETVGASALPANQSTETPLLDKLLAAIHDADLRTAAALHHFEHRLPDAAFASALESLEYRRSRPNWPALTSEARYVVAALSAMEREGQYRR